MLFAHTEIITLHYMLENIESQLMETGLSLAGVYLVSIDAMDKIFTDHRDPEKLQQLRENITKEDSSLYEQEKQYALRLLYLLKDKQYKSEGQRLIMAMQARNMLERTYIRKKYAVE